MRTKDDKLTEETVRKIFDQHILPAMPSDEERYVGLARNYAQAMEMFVVAHEAGHIALSHGQGPKMSYEISRNNECAADGFAASALDSCAFREYGFLGQVFVTIFFVWIETIQKNPSRTNARATTHPHGIERFRNALESNGDTLREADEEFGLSRDRLVELLPEGAWT